MADLALFRMRIESYEGRVHEVDSIAAARALAGELVAGETVSRWGDAVLEGIASGRDASPPDAGVSLIVADVGVAETGAIGFAHGAGRPRAAGLLPPRQIALLREADLVETAAEALARFFGSGAPPANVVFVAGPSRTSDVEQRSIRGVHAPGELDVIVYR